MDWKASFSLSRKSVCLLLALFASMGSAGAASFDCSKAATLVERTICTNDELSKLDDAMGEAFESEVAQESRAQKLKTSQRAWVAIRNRCTDATCLIQRYEERIAELACDKDNHRLGSAIGNGQCSHFQLRILERQLQPLLEARAREVLDASNNIEDSKTVLAEEDRAWRVYRDAQCSLYGATEGGSDGWKNAFAGHCAVNETKKRIESLKPVRKSK